MIFTSPYNSLALKTNTLFYSFHFLWIRISIPKSSRRHLFAIKFFLREFKCMLLPYYIYNKLNILGLFRYFR